jgi:hypothetical protein
MPWACPMEFHSRRARSIQRNIIREISVRSVSGVDFQPAGCLLAGWKPTPLISRTLQMQSTSEIMLCTRLRHSLPAAYSSTCTAIARSTCVLKQRKSRSVVIRQVQAGAVTQPGIQLDNTLSRRIAARVLAVEEFSDDSVRNRKSSRRTNIAKKNDTYRWEADRTESR